MLTPDLNEAQRFLDALGPDEDWTFQSFDDKTHRKDGSISRIMQGNLQETAKELARLNRRGAGVFVMVNEGDGGGRKKENVIRVRAAFVDLDGAPLEPVLDGPLAPALVVESSPGKWHAYWPLRDCPLESFSTLQAALAAKFGGDPAVKDLPRVMRLPGFYHQKGDPFMTRIAPTMTYGDPS